MKKPKPKTDAQRLRLLRGDVRKLCEKLKHEEETSARRYEEVFALRRQLEDARANQQRDAKHAMTKVAESIAPALRFFALGDDESAWANLLDIAALVKTHGLLVTMPRGKPKVVESAHEFDRRITRLEHEMDEHFPPKESPDDDE